jgi:alkylhydroperoxidase/carboxymuconolactone decarboxylase family protein YurZ
MKAKRKPAATKKKPVKRPVVVESPRSQSEAAQAALAEAERLFRAQAREAPARSAAAHFIETLGQVPSSVQALIDLAPGALPGYVALREFAYGGALDRRTVELLFAVLDVVEGHTEAAKAHVEEAVKAGLTVPQLAEALTVAMMVSGISTFATSGHHVLRHAARAAEERA